MKQQAYVTMNRLTHSWIVMQPNKSGGYSPCAAYSSLQTACNACEALNYPSQHSTQQKVA